LHLVDFNSRLLQLPDLGKYPSVFSLVGPRPTKHRRFLVIPPEPPVANPTSPQRRAVGKGAPAFGAAERTLAREHRCGITGNCDGQFWWDREELVHPAGEFRAAREEGGFQRGKKP
jgi:hypothetical protein